MNIEHISVSRKGCWDNCKCSYKFKYHLKIPVEGPEPPYFAYGKTIHKIAEEYVERGDPEAFHDIVLDVVTGKIEIEPGKTAPPIEGDYKKKFPLHLKNLKDFTNKVGIDHPGHVEYQFKYDLSPPNGYMTTGFIDRIIIKGDEYFIVDYKTTKKGPFRKDRYSVLNDLQLRMYAKVVQRDFGAPADKIHCCLYYVDGGNGELVGATFSQESIDAAEREMLESYIAIKNTPPEEAYGRVGNHCRRCDYRKICPFYSLT